MPKMMIHDVEARAALGRGIAKLARAVTGTLGPQGLNVIIDRPIGTPIVSRDGVSVAHEVELECPFENMGAQIAREASGQTNEIAGDGTTTAIAIAASLVDSGLQFLLTGSNAVGTGSRPGAGSRGGGQNLARAGGPGQRLQGHSGRGYARCQ